MKLTISAAAPVFKQLTCLSAVHAFSLPVTSTPSEINFNKLFALYYDSKRDFTTKLIDEFYGELEMFKKAISTSTIFLISLLFLVLLGCSHSAAVSTTTSQGQQPIEIDSVTGPMQPINPGGPVVTITLNNVSAEPVIALSADLNLGQPFNFDFDVTSSNPFKPGASISSTMTLINGGFNSDQTYPLTVTGTFQSENTFSFTDQVKITPPK